jgi:hypothetical protein
MLRGQASRTHEPFRGQPPETRAVSERRTPKHEPGYGAKPRNTNLGEARTFCAYRKTSTMFVRYSRRAAVMVGSSFHDCQGEKPAARACRRRQDAGLGRDLGSVRCCPGFVVWGLTSVRLSGARGLKRPASAQSVSAERDPPRLEPKSGAANPSRGRGPETKTCLGAGAPRHRPETGPRDTNRGGRRFRGKTEKGLVGHSVCMARRVAA